MEQEMGRYDEEIPDGWRGNHDQRQRDKNEHDMFLRK